MMPSIDVITLIISLILSVASLTIVIWSIRRMSSSLDKALSWIGPASVIIEAFSGRLTKVQQDLGKLKADMDMLELRLSSAKPPIPGAKSMVGSGHAQPTGSPGGRESSEDNSERVTSSRSSHIMTGSLAVLYTLKDGEKSASEVSRSIRRSREHTSRLLKAMLDQGLVSRSASRPYVYRLTEKGREALSQLRD